MFKLSEKVKICLLIPTYLIIVGFLVVFSVCMSMWAFSDFYTFIELLKIALTYIIPFGTMGVLISVVYFFSSDNPEPAESKLEKEHGELKEALEAFCIFHEHNASWDKTGSVYYNAKKVLNRVNDVEDGIK